MQSSRVIGQRPRSTFARTASALACARARLVCVCVYTHSAHSPSHMRRVDRCRRTVVVSCESRSEMYQIISNVYCNLYASNVCTK